MHKIRQLESVTGIPIPIEGVCSTNYIIPVDRSAIFYFAIAGNTGGISIYGNIQQQGYCVVFDNLKNSVISPWSIFVLNSTFLYAFDFMKASVYVLIMESNVYVICE